MILGVHGCKYSHTKQSSHSPTIKLTTTKKLTLGSVNFYCFSIQCWQDINKEKQWSSGCYTKKKEQQSRYSEISKESRDFSSRALFPAWSYLCVYLCTISVILNVMFSCMRKYLNKNGKPGMGSDPKEKLWNLGVRVNWTKSWIYTDRCVFLETD